MEKNNDVQEAGIGSLNELLSVFSPKVEDAAPLEEIGESLMIDKSDEVKNKKDSSLNDDTTQVDEGEDDLVDNIINNSEEPNKDQVISPKSKEYRSILSNMFGDTLSTVVIEDENGNDVEVSLDEIEIDEELFNELSSQAIESIKKSVSEETVSVKGLSDTAKRLIEIDRNGGDISDLINLQKKFVHPLEGLDIENSEEDQVKVILMRQRANGVPDEDIKVLIKGWMDSGVLKDKASIAESELRKHFDSQIELREKQTMERKKAQEEQNKLFRKSFRDNMGSFQLNENMKKSVSNFALKENPENGLREMDLRYAEFRNDPDKAVKLAMFLYDTDEYNKQVSSEHVKKSKLETSSKIKIVRSSSSNSSKGSKASNSGNIGSLDELNIF